MKKLMLMVAMLAMMLAMAAPAFAQTIAVDEGDDVEYNAGAQNLIGSVGDITNTQTGTATAVAVDDSTADATVDQTQEVSISQTNEFGNGLFFWGWWWF
jgi:membrane protein implicated in regulation of membrane protease activity